MIATKGETMSLKYKIPALLTGMLVLTSFKNSTSEQKSLYHIHMSCEKHMPDALRVVSDTTFYKADMPSGEQEPKLTEFIQNLRPRVVETITKGGTVCYVMNNGDRIERRGGTVAWRNNNPGCIRYSRQAVEMGATGKSSGFAVFPDEETGTQAIATLLRSDNYRNLTITAAIYKYAPPHENNTIKYINNLCNMVGVSRNTRLHTLNDKQMERVVAAIRVIEGWREGIETITPAVRHYVNPAEQFFTLRQSRLQKNLFDLEHSI